VIQRISIQPHQLRDYTELKINSPGPLNGFPLLTIDADTYIIGAEIQSGINFDVDSGRHCIAIGKGCSLAEAITFMVDLNHDYASVAQGEMSFLQNVKGPYKIRRKASIILQNDVWVGHGATIMAGVTLHNGCVVAADAVVTKDVPPYAIVGGNPARVLRWRFEEDIIAALQKIAWWDWPPEIQMARRRDFNLPAAEFVEKYLPEADNRGGYAPCVKAGDQKEIVLFAADAGKEFPLYPKILREYFEKDRPNTELLIYLPEENSSQQNVQAIETILEEYVSRDSYVTLQTGLSLDEDMLFQAADYFVTARSRQTVRRTCLADRYNVKLLYGTDEPVFPPELV